MNPSCPSPVIELNTLPLSNRLLKQTRVILMQGVRGEHKHPGEFRTTQNWIGGSGLADAAFIPPHQENLLNLMSDLEQFWHNQAVTVPHLVRLAISHYQFETIHPFSDGNGRIGRLLIPLDLMSHGVLAKPSLYLSDFFERNRSSYYDALIRVRVGNDMIHWVRFFLQGITETASKGRDVFQKILLLRTDADKRVLTLGKRAPNACAALDLLYSRPIVAAGDLEHALGVSKPTAHALVRDLERLGLLTETTGQMRDRLYTFDPYPQLFLS
jgi:Fic family protein